MKIVNNLHKLIFGVILLLSLFVVAPANAAFDYIFFSVNGDTTLSAMTQGDDFFWGSNCNLGATISWEIWFDANSNSVVDTTSDFLLATEFMTDGFFQTDGTSTPDGWVIAEEFALSGAIGNYIFRATDLDLDSTLQKTITMAPMASPPNQITGQLTLPGITPPNSLLANRLVIAESETGDEGVFIGATDNNGNYTLNIGANGTGVEFGVTASNITNYVTPHINFATVSGLASNIDFLYLNPTDSIYGLVKDQGGSLIPHEVDVAIWSDNAEKYTTTKSGRYVIYINADDVGDWRLENDSRNSPYYLTGPGLDISYDLSGSINHDFTVFKTNAKIYVKVTENGGLPTSNYSVNAYSSTLELWGEAVSGTGSDNVVALDVTSFDPSGWEISVNKFDDDFPIPSGLIVTNGFVENVSIGDTVTFDFINGISVSGTITQEAGDSPANWDNVWIGGSNVSGGSFETRANFDGSFELFTTAGAIDIGLYAEGYIFNPQWRSVNVATPVTGVDFEMNQTHCRVTGTFVNIPTPMLPFYNVYAFTGSLGNEQYITYGTIDTLNGTYEIFLSDGDWTIVVPEFIDIYTHPGTAQVTIGEAPDNSRTIDFTYTSSLSCCFDIRGNVNNIPNPDLAGAGGINVSDILFFVNYSFTGGPAPECEEEADVNGDSNLNVSDILYLVNYSFTGGPAPVICP